MKKHVGALMLTATVTLLGMGITPHAMHAQAQTVKLPHNDITVPMKVLSASSNLGAVGPSQPYSFGVVLPSRNAAGLAAFAQAVSQKGNARYHQFLNKSQLLAQFGPDQSALSPIQTNLTKSGFTTSMSGQVLTVTGTVGQFNSLFGTQLTRYSNSNNGTFVAPSSAITIPTWLQTATGLTGIVKSVPKPQTVITKPNLTMQYAPASSMKPAPTGSTTTYQSGSFQVTAQLVGKQPIAPGEAVRYLVTATLSGQPDMVSFASMSGPIKGTGSFIASYYNPYAGQTLFDFTMSRAQSVSMALTVTDGTNTATLQLPTATFVGPSVATTSISSLVGSGSGTIVAPWNPSTNSVNSVFHAKNVVAKEQSAILEGNRPSIGVFTAGGMGDNGVLDSNSFSVPESDEAAFANQFGLTPENFTVDYIGSDSEVDSVYGGIEGEMSLDLQMMETSAPGANIHIYSAGDFSEALNAVVNDDDVKVFSISYGEGDLDLNSYWAAGYDPGYEAAWDQLAEAANAEGITIVVSSGDDGAYSGAQDVNYGVPQSLAFAPQPSFPASSAYVTAIGGTEDSVTTDGALSQAALWGGNLGQDIPNSTLLQFLSLQNMMGAGGISSVEPAPLYQKLLNPGLTGRMVPDLSLPASVVTPGYFGFFDGQPGLSGGTSAGAPLFSGWVADLASEYGVGLGNINPVLYASSLIPGEFSQVAFGNNGVDSVTAKDNPVTGLGQPNIDSYLFN